MLAIYKYPLEFSTQTVLIPRGSKPLSVQMQGNHACLWALVDTDHETVSHVVRIFGTGAQIPPDIAPHYAGTVQDGSFVWHYFVK